MNSILSCSLLFCCLEVSGQCMTIGSILDSLTKSSAHVVKPKTYKKASGFDFNSFTPIVGERGNPNDYFIIGYDDSGVPRSVEHFEKSPRLSTFVMLSIDFRDFRAFFLKDPERQAYHPIVFVLVKKTGKKYFISTSPQRGFEVQRVLHDEIPIMSIPSITSIMLLDDQFYPTHMLRFLKGQLFMATSVKYREGSKYIDYEDASVYHPYFGGLPSNLKSEMCLSELDELKDTYTPLRFSLEPNILEPNREMPLWVWDGSHDYVRR